MLPRLITACVAAVACALPATAFADSGPSGFTPFAPDSVWNLPLRADAPLNAQSDRYVSWFDDMEQSYGGWINSGHCSMPLYWADADTPTVAVALDHPSYQDPGLERAWSAVPIPSDAAPADCVDHNFSVAQVQPDGAVKEWEFWGASRDADGRWTALWGGAMADMRTNRGIASGWAWFDPTAPTWSAQRSSPGWNVTASSVSQNAGVITQDELRSGHIDHAVALAIHDAARNRWFWPAQRTDGGLDDTYATPEGAHLRLPADLDLSKIAMSPAVRMIAEAAQKYGIVVRDRTFDANVFYVQPPAAGQADALDDLLGGQYASEALKAFPWSKLQLLDAPICTDWSGCSATQTAVISVDHAASISPGDALTLDTTNSVLNQPRTAVRWDLDGDGSYETDGGVAVKHALTAGAVGPHTVGVSITTLDGSTVTGTATYDVSASDPSTSAGSAGVGTPSPAADAGSTAVPPTTPAADPPAAGPSSAPQSSTQTTPPIPDVPTAPSAGATAPGDTAPAAPQPGASESPSDAAPAVGSSPAPAGDPSAPASRAPSAVTSKQDYRGQPSPTAGHDSAVQAALKTALLVAGQQAAARAAGVGRADVVSSAGHTKIAIALSCTQPTTCRGIAHMTVRGFAGRTAPHNYAIAPGTTGSLVTSLAPSQARRFRTMGVRAVRLVGARVTDKRLELVVAPR